MDEGDGQGPVRADAAASLALAAVGPALDQLEVVVAEAPEERLGALQGPGVVVALEGGGGLVDQVGQAGRAWPGRAGR